MTAVQVPLPICTVYRGCHSERFEKMFKDVFSEKKNFLLICPPRFEFSEIRDLLRFLPFEKFEFIDDFKGSQESISQKRRLEESQIGEWGEDFKVGLFTSGTVEQNKKIVLYTEKNFKSSTKAIFDLFEEHENVFCYPQPYHIFGLSLGYAQALFEGKNLIVPTGRYGLKAHALWLEAADKYEDLVTLGTPTHFKDLIDYVETVDKKVPNTYSCILGGAKVDRKTWVEVKEKLKIKKPSVGYGCTEASPGLFHLPPGKVPMEDGDVGLPLDGVDLFFKKNGTFSFKGANLSRAWINSEGLHLCDELNVLDILKLRDSGTYVYTSRLQEVINRGGEKFFPQDLESLFFAEQSLSTVCLKQSCDRLGEDIFLLVEGEEKKETIENIKTLFLNKFKRGLSRENISFTSALPLNDSQKIDRKKCLTLIQKKK